MIIVQNIQRTAAHHDEKYKYTNGRIDKGTGQFAEEENISHRHEPLEVQITVNSETPFHIHRLTNTSEYRICEVGRNRMAIHCWWDLNWYDSCDEKLTPSKTEG